MGISMSESEPSNVVIFDNADPVMQQAYANARSTFRYFWREITWENQRVVPALDFAYLKAPFSDGPWTKATSHKPEAEQMWFGEIDFNGQYVSGVLLNSPNWLASIKQGDPVRLPINQITDWMYAINGEVFGAYTVNLLRSRMSRKERSEHDDAWGLNFGNPSEIRITPERGKGKGLLKTWFNIGRKQTDTQEHPMSESMAQSLKSEIAKNPSIINSKNDRGWTLLHHHALGGNTAIVKTLLEAGANKKAVTNDGKTPLQLATAMQWDRVIALLS